MKKIILIGKMNAVLKDLNSFLTKYFQVQICSETLDVIQGMMKVVLPDLALVSLVGEEENKTAIFNFFENNFAELPVVTIGTESEKKKFLRFYENDQFQNLIRPVENSLVLDTVAKKLNLDSEHLVEIIPENTISGKKRIIVVDDNAATLRSVKGMLEEDYEIIIVNSGVKAMTAIGKKRPDLILLDYEMPVCDGRQTLEMIRSDDEIKDIPVIFLTGVGDREHIEAVLTLRPAGYLLKPPTKQKLCEAIEQVFAKEEEDA